MRRLAGILLALLLATTATAGTGRIVIVNADGANEGFNDPTPVAPVGGNPGTTRGEQRLNVFLSAAEHWRKVIDTNVDIIANARFPVIPGCTADQAILGQAAPNSWRDNFANAPQANTWYPIALANKFAGSDLEPLLPDIVVQFNSGVDNATCLGATSWYYGLDGNAGTDIDLYVVVLHELGHGLGFSGAFSDPDFRAGKPSVFDTHVLDRSLGLRWDQMTREQRQISMTNTGNLVWDGEATRNATAHRLDPITTLLVTEPAVIAADYDIGRADFGPPQSILSGHVVAALDAANGSGPTTTDGCTAITNAAELSGNIALIDRGSPAAPAPPCTFAKKARNAAAAGAIGVIIADNRQTTCIPPGMAFDGEGAPGDIGITTVSISQTDGAKLRAQLAGSNTVSVMLRVDPAGRAGATQDGYARLYAPCTHEPGSSVHHFDVTASPNLLMEPSINSDLIHDVDLTLYMLVDLGWTTRTGRRFLRR